ncbi:MAG: hypothetical protein IJO96_03200, partial [Oscillospiraceae bacterium]|nr:hypothetical protein [Oscillospiraceae bacterium]
MAENETLSGSVKETGSFESIEQLISYAKVDGKFHIAEAEEKSELPEDIQKQKKEKRKRRRRRWLLAIGRLFVLLLVLLLSVAALLLGVVGVICKGPSPAMRDKLVSTMMENIRDRPTRDRSPEPMPGTGHAGRPHSGRIASVPGNRR